MEQQDFIDSLNRLVERNVPLAAYRLPESEEIRAVAQKNPTLTPIDGLVNADDSGFLISPFKADGYIQSYLIRSDFEWTAGESLPDSLNELRGHETAGSGPVYLAEKEEYVNQVNHAVSKINSGFLNKVVLSRAIGKEHSEQFSPGGALSQFASNYPKAFCFLVHLPGIGTWLGASPEKLLTYKDGKAETVALAGTRPVQEDEEVLWNEKNLVEHAFVSDFIRDALVNQGASNISVSGPTTVSTGIVEHLRTEFKFELTPQQLTATIGALHPTPAVSGTPRNDSIKFIGSLEKHDRKYYTGFLGPINQGEVNLFVNLRSMELVDNQCILYAGGGLVSDSDPEDEWQETNLKANTLLAIIEKI